MIRPLNTRQLTLPDDLREKVLAMKAHARSRPQIVHEYLKWLYPWLNFHEVWETGGMISSISTTGLDLPHQIHFLVSNIDDRVVTEYAGWPHFRLTI